MNTRAFIVALLALAPSLALAYSETEAFDRDPSLDPSGGGGGLAFTGSPRQHGLSCASCHIDGPTDIALRISSLLPDGSPGRLLEGGYLPGVVYEIEVAFDEDRLAPPEGCRDRDFEPCDLNLFSAEILDAEAQPAGTFCPVRPRDSVTGCEACPLQRAAGTRVSDGCRVIFADGFNQTDARWRNGVTATSFFWRAPQTPGQDLTLYVAAVDGRGKESPDGEATSYTGDGTAALALPLGRATEPSGCGQALFGLILLPGLLGTRQRRSPIRRSRRRKRLMKSR